MTTAADPQCYIASGFQMVKHQPVHELGHKIADLPEVESVHKIEISRIVYIPTQSSPSASHGNSIVQFTIDFQWVQLASDGP